MERSLIRYTGERAIPDMMQPNDAVLYEHLSRYHWAVTAIRAKLGVAVHRIVDAPCGSGYGTRILADAFPEAQVVGADIDPNAVKYAEQRYGTSQTRFLVYNLDNGPLPASAVDVVVCFEGIEHVRDHPAVAGYLTRLLRPGGLILVSTPLRGGSGGGSPYHTKEFLRPEFEDLFRPHVTEMSIIGQNQAVGDAPEDACRYFILEGVR